MPTFAGWRRLRWGLIALLVGLARAEPLEFSLSTQPLADALLAYSKQAKIEVLFSFDELRRVPSAAVIGRLEPEEALGRLLRGTGYVARRNGKGKFVITRATRPTGSIKGRLLTPGGVPARGLRVTIPEARQTVTTDDSGEFDFPSVPPGTYQLLAAGDGYQPLQMKGARVDADSLLTVDPQTMLKADDVMRLAPYVVKGESTHLWPVDPNRDLFGARVAAGNLDLPRTEDDPLPFMVYRRDQINRSGVVNLNEFLQRELLDSAAKLPPEQDPSNNNPFLGSNNLDLRSIGAGYTVIPVNGRRLPEVLTSASALTGGPENAQLPDVNFIPLSLVQRIEVLPVSASALYTGNAVGGVINIVLRPEAEATATEVNTTYTNALHRYDAPQSSVSLLHSQALLSGALRVRLSASLTRAEPPTEAELGYHHGHVATPNSLGDAVYAATPNVRSVDLTPLFGTGSSPVTSVAPGADGTGGLAAFAGREGLRNLDLFAPAGGLAASSLSAKFPYGRRQQRFIYTATAVYDVLPWLEVGLDGLYGRTVVNRGYDVLSADLTMKAGAPLNPFSQDIKVSLNETAPLLGEGYSEGRLEFSAAVFSLLLKGPGNWRVAWDTQYAHSLSKYRGLAGADSDRWQQLVDQGTYNPLRDTQVHGPPQEFYDQALIYYGARGRYATLGNYDTLDAALRITNQSLSLPTGVGAVSLGGDYRRNHLADYADVRRYADGSLASDPILWAGRTLQRYSVFGELQAPVLPSTRLPRWLTGLEADVAVRYIASDSSKEAYVAPTCGLKVDFPGGFSLRGSVTTSNRYPTPEMSRLVELPNGSASGGGGVNLVAITDPVRNETRLVQVNAVLNPNLQPEAAVTQTAGLIWQHGGDHRFHASMDFVDTRKTNELFTLGSAQQVVDLEALLPGWVIRGPLPPGDAHSAGPITAVSTGVVNMLWRRSQNWSASMDYTWTKCLGGALDLYGRLVYFPRFDVQAFPTSTAVDELRHPDGAMPGLLEYRANFGVSWSDRDHGFGLDGHYYHSRVLPAAEWAGQGQDRIRPFWQFDAFVQSDLTRWLPWKCTRFGLRGQLRVNNVFGADFPKYTNDSSGAGVQPYGDWRGRVYSVTLTATY